MPMMTMKRKKEIRAVQINSADEEGKLKVRGYAAGMGKVIKCTPNLGRVSSPSTWSPELLDLGRAPNAGPTESAPLWSTREPEPERLRPGKSTQPRTHFR